MRPINQTAGDKKTLTWREDTFAKQFDRYPVTTALHRYAGRVYSIGCLPKLSAIDKRYFAEVNHAICHDDGSYSHTVPNIALGTGDTPLHAALDGYMKARPNDIMWRVFLLEIEAISLQRAHVKAIEIEKRVDKALNTLTDVLDLYRAMLAAPRPIPAKPDEDDDL